MRGSCCCGSSSRLKGKVAVERDRGTQLSSLILCLESLLLNLRSALGFLLYLLQEKPIFSAHKNKYVYQFGKSIFECFP